MPRYEGETVFEEWDRKKSKRRCPKKCYLSSDGKYNICDKNCEISCLGIRVERARSVMWGRKDVEEKAKKMYYKKCASV